MEERVFARLLSVEDRLGWEAMKTENRESGFLLKPEKFGILEV